jgi:hypothetical protein
VTEEHPWGAEAVALGRGASQKAANRAGPPGGRAGRGARFPRRAAVLVALGVVLVSVVIAILGGDGSEPQRSKASDGTSSGSPVVVKHPTRDARRHKALLKRRRSRRSHGRTFHAAGAEDFGGPASMPIPAAPEAGRALPPVSTPQATPEPTPSQLPKPTPPAVEFGM